jgi:hypothetical protein
MEFQLIVKVTVGRLMVLLLHLHLMVDPLLLDPEQ